jgi:hypothetical protein
MLLAYLVVKSNKFALIANIGMADIEAASVLFY